MISLKEMKESLVQKRERSFLSKYPHTLFILAGCLFGALLGVLLSNLAPDKTSKTPPGQVVQTEQVHQTEQDVQPVFSPSNTVSAMKRSLKNAYADKVCASSTRQSNNDQLEFFIHLTGEPEDRYRVFTVKTFGVSGNGQIYYFEITNEELKDLKPVIVDTTGLTCV